MPYLETKLRLMVVAWTALSEAATAAAAPTPVLVPKTFIVAAGKDSVRSMVFFADSARLSLVCASVPLVALQVCVCVAE